MRNAVLGTRLAETGWFELSSLERLVSDHESGRQDHIERVIERVARAEHDDESTVERLVSEAAERLDDRDVYGDLTDRPVSEIIEQICRDLGLSPDWTILAKETWAREEMQSGEVGAPLKRFMTGRREDPWPQGADAPLRCAPSAASP